MTQPRPWRDIATNGGLAVLLIRHGRTALNAEHRFCGGRSDPPLDARGREQAAALVERFGGEVERVFCSPQRRALETAAVLGRATVIEALRELDQGTLEGRRFEPALAEHAAFFRAWKRDPSEIPVPGGGESMGALAERVAAGMREILDALDEPGGRVIAVVGHQMAQAAFVCRALDEPLRRWPEFQLRNASANLLAWNRGRWTLAGRNL